MSATPDSTVADPQQIIADLQRQLAECRAERDEALAERDKAQRRLAERTSERDEALEQQTATAEVLQVINSSPGDLVPVFDTILDKAMRLCGVDHAALELYDGERMHAVAVHGASDKFAETLRQGYPATESPASRTLLEGGSFVEIADAAQIDHVAFRTAAAVHGIRTVLFVPLQRDDVFLGMIACARREVRPFSEKEIALLQNFAAQAVIAMENARLITETREALEQQTATAEVLQVINSSPGDLAPVFDAMLEKATRLSDAAFGAMWTYDGERFDAVAHRNTPARLTEFISQPYTPGPQSPLGRIAKSKKVVWVTDLATDEMYLSGDRGTAAPVELGGARSYLAIPLLKDNALVGAMTFYRGEVRPFSDKQIALLQNFAAQAVIAIENARLLTETREALEQQTATAEVLQVINSSPGDLAPVFDAMLERAKRLCEADVGTLWTFDGERFFPAVVAGYDDRGLETGVGVQPSQGASLGRLINGEDVVHVLDVVADPGYQADANAEARTRAAGSRTVLAVALRKDGTLLGAITTGRRVVRAYSDKQIALLQNFAAQAVIAMENARLLTETREALEQQTATAEVLQVINSSPGDLTPVFEAVLDKATSLCDAAYGILWTYDRERFYPVALHRTPPPFADFLRSRQATGFNATGIAGLGAMLDGEAFQQTGDPAAGELYRSRRSPLNIAFVELGGARSGLIVPLRKEGKLLGAIRLFRQEVRPFSNKQIALLQNFAAQAVIAMENARLLTETREALEQQTATAEVLGVINSSPGDLAPVFDSMLERATRLCEAVFGVMLIPEGDYLRTVASRGLPPALENFLRQPVGTPAGSMSGRLRRGEAFVHIADIADDEGYRDPTNAVRSALVDLGGARTGLAVALRKEADFLGAIWFYRQEVRPFSDKQIALLENFAAQAVIAMENARLLTETREALEQQTATAEVLQVINSSPGDLAPVFDAILEKAQSLCGAAYGSLQLYDGERFRAVAVCSYSEAFAERLREGTPAADNPFAAPLFDGRFVHIPDLADIDHPMARAAVELTGVRTALFVPLRKGEVLLGMISAVRQEVRPFSGKQIALLQNFAAQAVIAMENARLLTETREALDQQTATAEVLQVINSSPGNLEPVFDAMLEKAMDLCEAAFGGLFTRDGERVRAVATHGLPNRLDEFVRAGFTRNPESGMSRGEAIEHIADISQLSVLAQCDIQHRARTTEFYRGC